SFSADCAFLFYSVADLDLTAENFSCSRAKSTEIAMSWLKAVVVAGAIQALAAIPVHAGENFDAIKSAGVIKIGTEGTYAPFTYHDDTGKLVGFDVEIGEAVAERLGV